MPMSVSAAADEGVAITPVAQAAYIRFASWSPDGRWFAFWQSTARGCGSTGGSYATAAGHTRLYQCRNRKAVPHAPV
ncbi:MAG: hypothetical protein M5U34_04050 [Chloroflexi bacterium]|nr:hypothetical protein [Chloroflexota bacterium]